ncbi:MAG: hypothetical protein EHM24_33725 [Acidobacteria bacterium]|nr:MAG: hypothetical protein EHM24_33725 [Acidobacteriota bacterium]
MYLPLLATVMIAVPVGVAAQMPQVRPPAARGPAVELSQPSTPQPGPYSKLFSGQLKAQPEGGLWRLIPEPKQNEPAVKKPRTKVVCGMTLVLVDPVEVDPEMTKPTPKQGVRFTMRNFPAPACKDK